MSRNINESTEPESSGGTSEDPTSSFFKGHVDNKVKCKLEDLIFGP